MVSLALLCSLVGRAADRRGGYFTGLARPPTARVEISRGGGPVILIVIDALRPDHLTPYGYGREPLPPSSVWRTMASPSRILRERQLDADRAPRAW